MIVRVQSRLLPVLLLGVSATLRAAGETGPWPLAAAHGELAREGLIRCHDYVRGWLAHADPVSGLIPRNLDRDRDIWNPQDSAADNYPFLVLSTALTDRSLFEGRMLDMLNSEIRLTSRLGPLPDVYAFSRRGFLHPTPDPGRIVFGASEYVKDGLLPLTEWLGPSPWSDRMLEILDALWAGASVETPGGRIVSDNVEINGEMLQTLSRVYWMTGEPRYLDWAVRLGDYYLLGQRHPTRDFRKLRLRDHGCEIVSGLCELYATCYFARPAKAARYRGPVREMLDRILAVGRNGHGLFHNEIDPVAGAPLPGNGAEVADTWGYTFNGIYTVYLLDGTAAYREAVRRALSGLWEHYASYPWEKESADGYADAIEGALNLYRREPIDSAARWIDREIRVMWSKQRPDGVIEAWHGDGNFARTTLMYILWKTQGVTVQPWRPDLRLGAVVLGDTLYLQVDADQAWAGRLLFDLPRHRVHLGLPLDWPRINQFPEWFVVDPDRRYTLRCLRDGGADETHTRVGAELQRGWSLTLAPGVPARLQLSDSTVGR